MKFIYKKKEETQNYVVLAQLTAGHNWSLTEYQIDNNWKLEDWNEKDWMLEGQFCIFTYNLQQISLLWEFTNL